MVVRIAAVKRDCARAESNKDLLRRGMDNVMSQTENRRPMKMNRPLVLVLGLLVAPAARAQIAAAPPVAASPPAAPAPSVPPEASPAPQPPPPVEPAPGYGYGVPGYGPPAPYYYYHHRYRPMPYGYQPPPGYPLASAPAEPMESFHTHDGFFLQVHVGISATGFSSKQAGVKTNYAGGGISSGVAVGGVIAHNLILYGAFFGTDTANPDKQMDGTSVTSDLGELGVGAFGPGLAYYFERCNLYLSATFGLAAFGANDGNGVRVDSSRSGAAFDFMVGKEWWVSRDWGLGIAGELMAASLKDKNTPGLTWSASGLSILFSATYN
jgi:hypothetical protein